MSEIKVRFKDLKFHLKNLIDRAVWTSFLLILKASLPQGKVFGSLVKQFWSHCYSYLALSLVKGLEERNLE